MGGTGDGNWELRSLWDAMDTTHFGPVRDMTLGFVSRAEITEFCQRWHYSNGGGSMLWNYGLFDGEVLVGVVSYNMPTMRTCAMFFGEDRWHWVAHMGRLVCADHAPRNVESRLIAESLKQLKRDKPGLRAVVTFAATGQGHIGYVYQATNALYTGVGGRSYAYVDQHGRMRSTNNIDLTEARHRGWTVTKDTGKHRYLYLLGSRAEKREALSLLQLPVLPYPKAVS